MQVLPRTSSKATTAPASRRCLRRVSAPWKPNPDRFPTPQHATPAYESKADIIGPLGRRAGGKLTDVGRLNKHRRSVIFRRVFPNLRAIIERSREILATDKPTPRTVSTSLHRWSLDGGRGMLEFEACQRERDKYKQRRRARLLRL